MSKTYTGRCVCGEVSYKATDPAPLWYCHCEQCRRMTGNVMVAAQVKLDAIEIAGEPKWFYLNEKSRHGFCGDCGSQLFWRNDDNEYLSITGGSLDSSEGLTVGGHIFTSEKADYYKVPEDELKFLRYWAEPPATKL